MRSIVGIPAPDNAPQSHYGPTVFVIASGAMGQGNDELDALLMKAFVHPVIDLEHRPDTMIFCNIGGKLAASESGVLDYLKALEEKGVSILLCGTCVNLFELGGKISAEVKSNMDDIAVTLSMVGGILKP